MKRPTQEQNYIIEFIKRVSPKNCRVVSPWDNSPDSPVFEIPPPNTLFIKITFSKKPHPENPKRIAEVPDSIRDIDPYGLTELRLFHFGRGVKWKVKVIHEMAHVLANQRFWFKMRHSKAKIDSTSLVYRPLGRGSHGPSFQAALEEILQGVYQKLGKEWSPKLILEISLELKLYKLLLPNSLKLIRISPGTVLAKRFQPSAKFSGQVKRNYL